MKVVLALLAALRGAKSVPYGPKGCVALTKSPSNTCVIGTSCAGVDTSAFEFSFDCVTGQKRQRHSYGLGGFDAHESFDTGVQCGDCEVPVPVAYLAKRNTKAGSQALKLHKADQVTETFDRNLISAAVLGGSTTAPKDAITFGPGKCVSLWRNSGSGHCVMQTNCAGQDTKQYDFGLICMNNGKPVRHLFGKDTFDASETFDTLILCDQCLGLDDVPDDIQILDEIKEIKDALLSMKTDMTDIEGNVTKLNKEVFKENKTNTSDAKNQTAKDSGKTDANETKVQLVASSDEHSVLAKGRKHHRRKHHRHGHLRRHRREDDEDRDEGDSNAADEDQDEDSDDEQDQVKAQANDQDQTQDDADDQEASEADEDQKQQSHPQQEEQSTEAADDEDDN